MKLIKTQNQEFYNEKEKFSVFPFINVYYIPKTFIYADEEPGWGKINLFEDLYWENFRASYFIAIIGRKI